MQLQQSVIATIVPRGYWYCGKCTSLIPLNFWHRCDATESHSGPNKN